MHDSESIILLVPDISKAVRCLYTVKHMQSYLKYVVSWRGDIVVILFSSLDQSFICCLQLLGYDRIK